MATTGAGKRILVVDDDPFVIQSIQWILKPAGYELESAESAQQALALLDKNNFDLVLTDYSMPAMRGDELAERVKQRLPHVPVIIMTAYAEMLECSLSPIVGVDQILCKPFMAGSLREAVARFLPKG